MILKRPVLDAIRRKDVSLAFRRFRKPTVKAGGRLRTAIGELSIDRVDAIDESSIRTQDARRAGYDSKAELLAALPPRAGTTLYRITLHFAGADSRVALRQHTDIDVEHLRKRLDRLDRQLRWTQQTLLLIRDCPGQRAAELAKAMAMPRDDFKRRVRQLKELGLTESLEVGYRLSPRGAALIEALLSAK